MTTTLVVGGTGAMGGAVVRRLTDRGHDVRVLTRDPESPRARALRELGPGEVTLVAGDLSDPDSVVAAFDGVHRAFCNTDFLATRSPVGEYQQGVGLLRAARAAGVDRLVWSSLDAAAALTGGAIPVPHYDSKAAVAAFIDLNRSEEMMTRTDDDWYTRHVSVLTTAPYFENFPAQLAPRPGDLGDGREGLVFAIPLGSGRYPLIALADIAWYAVHLLESWQSWGARDLAVVGDSLTGPEIAATFERVTGLSAGYAPVPLEAVREASPEMGHDFANMFEFFQQRDLAARDRDPALLRRLHPDLMSFEDWLRATGWRGEPG